MGQCVSSNTWKHKPYPYDKEPLDIKQFQNMVLSKLLFNVTIGNIKIKKCQYKRVCPRFIIRKQLDCKFEQKEINNSGQAKWKIQTKTKFQMTQLELRKSFLQIQVYNQLNKEISTLKINLYIIATGPYHQDFLIQCKNGSTARISFDFKISQIIDVKIQSDQVQIDLNKKHPGQKFSFSIKPIMQQTQNQLNISLPSYTVMQVLDDKQKNQIPDQVIILKRSSSIQIKQPLEKMNTGKNLIWTKQKSLQLPSVNLKILSSDLHYSYFQILIWRVNDQKQQYVDESEKLEYHAECFISFHKLMFNDFNRILQRDGKNIQQRSIKIQQKLWRNGRQCGMAYFSFNIENQVYMKQMPVFIRTQKGIQKIVPIFHSGQETQSSTQKQIQNLQKLNQSISNKMLQAQKLRSKFGGYRQARTIQLEIQDQLLDMKQIIQKSAKQKLMIYDYSSPQQLLIAQQTFLQIGNQICQYLQNQDHIINEICWLILIALLRRGEFTLAYIGFDDTQKKQIQGGKLSKQLQKKINTAQKYQQFIHKILVLTINSLNTQGLQYQKKFAQISCAFSYFRITEFRNQLLNSITRQNDQQISEWRQIQFLISQDQDFTYIRQQMSALSLLFDWQHSFQKYLSPKTDILDILNGQQSNTWKQRFSKRGVAFFQFIKRWIQYIEGFLPSFKGIQWKYCPGYNRILKAFFIEVKNRQILQYPDSLKQAALKLLVNQKVLSPLIMILFNKTNIYDAQTIMKVLQFMNDMFSCLTNRNKRIPAIFNFSNFLKGIKLIIQSDAAHSVCSALILIYNNFCIFPLEFQRNISMFLLSQVFFKLFLHWDQNVRVIFYKLFIYRILHEFDILRVDQNQNQQNRLLKKQYSLEIKKRYEKLMKILQSAKLIRYKEEKKNLKIAYEKQLYLKMKKKMQVKRRLRKISQSQNIQNISSQNLMQSQKQFSLVQQVKSQTRQATQNNYSLPFIQKPPTQKALSDKFDPEFRKALYNDYKIIRGQILTQNYRKSNSFHFRNEVNDLTQVDQQSKTNQHQIRNSMRESYPNLKFFGKQQCNFLQISKVQIREIKQYQIHYLKVGMKMFEELFDKYKENLLVKRIDIPIIKMQPSIIDKKEIRPDKIEDW